MKKQTKTGIIFLAVSVLLPCLFLALFLHENVKPQKLPLETAAELTQVTEYGIEQADILDGMILLQGWLLETPDTILSINRNFILSDGARTYKLNTVLQKREDITTRWNNGNNYDNSGLEGSCLASSLEKGRYRIGFLITDAVNKRYYLTDEYLEVH